MAPFSLDAAALGLSVSPWPWKILSPQHHGHAVAPDKFLSDDKRLGQAVGAGLYGVV